jgi:glycosyltransferase involved in cell wall biosynthesis
MEARVLDVWSHISPRYGGVGPAAAGLAVAIGLESGWHSSLLAVCDPDEQEFSDGIPETVKLVRTSGVRGINDARLRPGLAAAIAHCDVCHVHGMWLPHTISARSLARTLKKPILSSVHGMLEKWELNNKRLKKALYSFCFERPSLAKSHCLRALSEREAGDYRRYGLKNPIVIVPNGVAHLSRVPLESFYTRFPQLAGKQVVLFLSRVHYKKGILNLLKAWPDVIGKHKDAHLLVAGPNNEHTLADAQGMVTASRLADSVTFCGTISGDLKMAALSAARYFCLPSYSEGLSVAALEALSIGLPVILTPECNVDGVAEYGAGVVTSNDPSQLADVLSECLRLSDSQWNGMSQAAVRLARERFDWRQIAESLRSAYMWMMGGPKPNCFVG